MSAPPTESPSTISAWHGRPAAGIRVTLVRLLPDGAAVPAGEGRTDADGRIRALATGPLVVGDLCDNARLAQTLREHAIEAGIMFAGFLIAGSRLASAATDRLIAQATATYAMSDG